MKSTKQEKHITTLNIGLRNGMRHQKANKGANFADCQKQKVKVEESIAAQGQLPAMGQMATGTEVSISSPSLMA